MFVHMALFKWKDNVDPKDAEQAMHEIRQLKNVLPGIVGMRCGEAYDSDPHGYTHALVVSFKDLASLESYMVNPEHKKILSRIEHMKESIISVDFHDHS